MNIKIIIANNNDVLLNCLSNIALENKTKIEIIQIPIDKLSTLIYQIKSVKNLIILDPITSVSFCTNMLKNAINHINLKGNIIILVIDSKHISNIISQNKKSNFIFRREKNKFSLLNIINIITNTIRDTLEIEKKINNIFWKLGLTSYFK